MYSWGPIDDTLEWTINHWKKINIKWHDCSAILFVYLVIIINNCIINSNYNINLISALVIQWILEWDQNIIWVVIWDMSISLTVFCSSLWELKVIHYIIIDMNRKCLWDLESGIIIGSGYSSVYFGLCINHTKLCPILSVWQSWLYKCQMNSHYDNYNTLN